MIEPCQALIVSESCSAGMKTGSIKMCLASGWSASQSQVKWLEPPSSNEHQPQEGRSVESWWSTSLSNLIVVVAQKLGRWYSRVYWCVGKKALTAFTQQLIWPWLVRSGVGMHYKHMSVGVSKRLMQQIGIVVAFTNTVQTVQSSIWSWLSTDPCLMDCAVFLIYRLRDHGVATYFLLLSLCPLICMHTIK